MYRIYFLILFVLLISCAKKSQESLEQPSEIPMNTATQSIDVYDVYVAFHSIGTGTFSDKPLQEFLVHFENTQSVEITQIDKIGPLGREGEFALGIVVRDFTENQKKLFVQELKKINWNSNKGSVESHISISENQKISDINKPSIAKTTSYSYK